MSKVHAQTGVTPVLGMPKVTPFEFKGDLRKLPKISTAVVNRQRPYRPRLQPKMTKKTGIASSAVQPRTSMGSMPAPLQNFNGLSYSDICGGVRCGDGYPPDPNGAVGLNHFIEAVNTAFGIYSKTGTLLASFTEDQLFNPSGTNPCNGHSQGDPIVLYDQIADRWILTNFAFATDSNGNEISPIYECIAASKTGDPVSGGWWLFPIQMDPGGPGAPPSGTLADYPKFGIWPDCLYMSANEFNGNTFLGVAFVSLNRNDLYSGNPLTYALGFLADDTVFTMIPANVNGRMPYQLPASGTPGYFVSESFNFTFDVRKFVAGPDCGAGGTLSAPVHVSQTTYNSPNNIPQPGTGIKLDSLGDELMQRVQYRKVGSAESLWVVHSTQTTSAPSVVQQQWAQIDVTGGVVGTAPVQQQIYAPDTTLFRWAGSLEVDNEGNMAVGYSTSNGTAPNYPSIAYTGRLATDSANTLRPEVQLIAGSGSQTNRCGGAPCDRWGDYSGMSIDPTDDCTFWYTNEYYSSSSNGASGNWQTRIGAFKFPSCTAPKKRKGQIISPNNSLRRD